jgi:hypothetical protein
VGSGGNYRGERLQQPGTDFLEALTAGRVAPFLRSHPELITKG